MKVISVFLCLLQPDSQEQGYGIKPDIHLSEQKYDTYQQLSNNHNENEILTYQKNEYNWSSLF